MTAAYAEVMRRMAEGAPAGELARTWRQAEARRRTVEAGGQATPDRGR
jgi:hypothetical protein